MTTDTNAHDILLTGDFDINKADSRNSNKIKDLCQEYDKIKDLCQEYGLSQLISDLTHYTETSQSTIDLILTNNSNRILTSGVGSEYSLSLSCILCFRFSQTENKIFQKAYMAI